MNNSKKRKLPPANYNTVQAKKSKFDPNKLDSFKQKKKNWKKITSVSSNRNSNFGVITTTQKQSTEKSSHHKKKRQWQSVKEKRQRLKKKYLLSGNSNSTVTEHVTISSPIKPITDFSQEAVKIPTDSSSYSSNWKNLMKTLNIKLNRKKKKIKTEQQDSTKEVDKKESEIWFDDVDDILLDRQPGTSSKEQDNKLVKQESFTGLTKDIAMDCEMVGVGWEGKENQLARVSIVNHHGNCVYDKFVKPKEKVEDYRTHVSGIRPENIKKGESFENVQKDVSDILTGRLLIGHAIHNDLKVLYISHPKHMIRDTSRYKPFRQLFDGRNPSLKKLTAKVLGVSVQEGEHSSIQDAQAAMRLYTMHRKQWEKDFKAKHIKKTHKKKKKKNK